MPVYPVPGNHEQNSQFFFKYFSLPENGDPAFAEHWWYKDYSNVRLIGLESNSGYRVQQQLVWLQSVLNDAATDSTIDFVFAQLHHPHKSELWIACVGPSSSTFSGFLEHCWDFLGNHAKNRISGQKNQATV